MLVETANTITSILYSEVSKELTIKYNDGKVCKYLNVPKEIYEGILQNGKNASDYLMESLESNYKKLELV